MNVLHIRIFGTLPKFDLILHDWLTSHAWGNQVLCASPNSIFLRALGGVE